MKKKLDPIEAEYEIAIRMACQEGDNDHALELATGLNEYQQLYKIEGQEPDDLGMIMIQRVGLDYE